MSDQSEDDGEKKNQNIRKAYACDDEDDDEGDKVLKKGQWTISEDAILVDYVQKNGEGNWTAVEKNSGFSRSGKSCRMRWKYYLRPDLKKCSFSKEEELRVVERQAEYGNKWARIATEACFPLLLFQCNLCLLWLHELMNDYDVIRAYYSRCYPVEIIDSTLTCPCAISLTDDSLSSELPGRTDQDVKNFWRTKGLRIAGKPVYPSGIVLNHSTQLQSHYSLPFPTSSLHEVPPLFLTRRNCPSHSYNSYPIVNASEMNEIPPVDQHVYSPEVVAEPLVEPSPQSLVGVSPDTSSFGQTLSDVVPGSPDISNYSDNDYSNIFSEAPNLDPDACLSSQGTPAADDPLCLNQSSPAHPCQPVHPSPPGGIGHLEDIAYQEKLFPSQITVFSTAIVPTKDVNKRSYSPLGGNASFMSNAFTIHESSAEENQPFDEDAFVASFLNDNEEPDDMDNSKPDDDVLNSI